VVKATEQGDLTLQLNIGQVQRITSAILPLLLTEQMGDQKKKEKKIDKAGI
jgi:hypothetical protein